MAVELGAIKLLNYDFAVIMCMSYGYVVAMGSIIVPLYAYLIKVFSSIIISL